MAEKVKKNGSAAVWKSVLLGTGITAAAFLIFTGIFAVLISAGILSEDNAGWTTALCCALSSFLGGKAAMIKAGNFRFLPSILPGTFFCVALLLLGKVFFLTFSVCRESAICAMAAVLGGLLAHLFKGRKKKKRRK